MKKKASNPGASPNLEGPPPYRFVLLLFSNCTCIGPIVVCVVLYTQSKNKNAVKRGTTQRLAVVFTSAGASSLQKCGMASYTSHCSYYHLMALAMLDR